MKRGETEGFTVVTLENFDVTCFTKFLLTVSITLGLRELVVTSGMPMEKPTDKVTKGLLRTTKSI